MSRLAGKMMRPYFWKTALLVLAMLPYGKLSAEECAPRIEERPNGSPAFHPHANAFLNCRVSEKTYGRVIKRWIKSRPAATRALTGIGLGRAIQYPWVSQYLEQAALSSPLWDPAQGSGRNINDNAAVKGLLSNPEFVRRLDAPFKGTPYRITALSVEKVLISQSANSAKLPYDAQLWITLQTKPSPSRP